MGTTGKVILGVVIGFFVVGFLGITTCALCAGAVLSEAVEQPDVDTGPEKQLPWLQAVQANCQRYDAAPNDIQKSAVFQANESHVRGQQLTDVRGALESASTGHGGGGLLLTARVGRAEFVQSGIRSEDALYAQASNLVEGQCVIFTAQVKGTSRFGGGGFIGSMEKNRICGRAYNVRFASIAACPQ